MPGLIEAARAAPRVPGGAIELRLAAPDDRALLERIYAGTREAEMAQVPWCDEDKARFLSMQFEAQDTYYRAHYPDPEFFVILRHGVPVGRLYLCRAGAEIRVMDVSLLPPCRGQGIGGAILGALREQARAERRCLTLHVEQTNPARALYARHGFAAVEDRGIRLLMRWPAPGADEPAPT